jgi:hypothetical protein
VSHIHVDFQNVGQHSQSHAVIVAKTTKWIAASFVIQALEWYNCQTVPSGMEYLDSTNEM